MNINEDSYDCIRGTWYSDFKSPSSNWHYFTLNVRFASGSEMALVADRTATDKRLLKVNYRVHVEVCGEFVAILAKDAAKDSLGVNAMILKASDDKLRMQGRLIWNSLSSGTIEEGQLEWTRMPSAKHAKATKTK